MSGRKEINGSRYRTASRAVLISYWLALFAGTHWPNFHLDAYPQNTDKVLHFVAYAGLSFLLANYLSTKRRVRLHEAVQIFTIVAAYAVVDELLQYPVGRSCDLLDAIADWTGSLIGLSVFAGLRRIVRGDAALRVEP